MSVGNRCPCVTVRITRALHAHYRLMNHGDAAVFRCRVERKNDHSGTLSRTWSNSVEPVEPE